MSDSGFEMADPTDISALAAHFEAVSRALSPDASQPASPTDVVRVAASSVPHGQHCGITLIRASAKPETIAATDQLPYDVDLLQYEVREGPCLDAAAAVDAAVVDDLARDDRWPRFSHLCAERTGVRSMMSLKLPLWGEDVAAINFYAFEPAAFDDIDVGVGSILATFAALSVQAQVHQADTSTFRDALHTSRQIGTAVGIVMARERVTSDEAFQLLRQASSQLNRKLVEVAGEVQRTGGLPDADDDRPR